MGQSQRERERGEEESKERGGARKGTMSADRERERHQREGEKVSVGNERETDSGIGALTQRCHTLKGMCWLWEVVLLSQMTSPSLLKTIG